MMENLGFALLLTGALTLWLVPADFVGKLGKLKGRGSCLWQALAVFIPGSPIVTIPLLLYLPSKGVTRVDWRKLISETIILGIAVFFGGGMVLFVALQYIIGR